MNRKKISLLLALTMLIGSLLGGCGVSSAEESDLENGVPEKEGYTLDFSTEFNDGKLDAESWLPQYLPHCTTNTAGSSARYKVEDGCLNLYITKDSPDYFGGQPGSVDPDNLLCRRKRSGTDRRITPIQNVYDSVYVYQLRFQRLG